MKNGTCKFGQSCKFHHPFCSTIPVRPSSFEGNAYSQSLPQRPGETNCAFFMKNGTCKYGAACKFHHPCDSLHIEQRIEELSSVRNDRSVSAGTHCGILNEETSQYHIDFQNWLLSDKKEDGVLNSRVDSPSLTSSSASSSYGTHSSCSEQELLFSTIPPSRSRFDDPWATCRNSNFHSPQCTRLKSLVQQTHSRPSSGDANTQTEHQYNISEGQVPEIKFSYRVHKITDDPLEVMTSSLLSMLDFEDHDNVTPNQMDRSHVTEAPIEKSFEPISTSTEERGGIFESSQCSSDRLFDEANLERPPTFSLHF